MKDHYLERSKTLVKKEEISVNGVKRIEEKKRRYAIGNRATKALK